MRDTGALGAVIPHVPVVQPAWGPLRLDPELVREVA